MASNSLSQVEIAAAVQVSRVQLPLLWTAILTGATWMASFAL
jgi:hypothetical protein